MGISSLLLKLPQIPQKLASTRILEVLERRTSNGRSGRGGTTEQRVPSLGIDAHQNR